jgi:hypothetical protein
MSFGPYMTISNIMANCSSNSSAESDSVLPYTDTKPVGAADFYAAINATFRFIEKQFGIDGLRRYWTDLGQRYYAPVSDRWQAGGLTAVAAYWRAFFAAEPEAEVEVIETENEVQVEVHTCPAIRYLRAHNREIVPCFCQQCAFVSAVIGSRSGIEVRLSGGNGTCTQRFAHTGHFSEPQNLEDIARTS